ncbi:MAG: glycosyltransferase family 4 protein [Candidatus Sumerlaeia bacterium]|nr:glycosyltransferase family 4 protein [Candidatus Sumerlaeia bacterium]
MSAPRIGFIIQRYGPEVVGGAESLCRAIARRLSAHWDIEVLTTCAIDHMTWANEFPEGLHNVEGIAVRRFAVDSPRNVRRFNRCNERILMKFHTAEDESRWMGLQGPRCTRLQHYLQAHRSAYDGFVVFNYLYATTYDSLERLGGQFYLLPFAHDEPPIYLRLFEDVFCAPRGIIFCTEEERGFVEQRFPFHLPRHEVIGLGVDMPEDADGERFCAKYGIREPFILYAGRIDASKNCDTMLYDFVTYWDARRATGKPLSLVLCGANQLTLPRHPAIRYLGFVSEQDKWDAMAAARFLVLPSRFESLSIVLLEAWAVGTPVLVNSRCGVSMGQCRRSGGGLCFCNTDEFIAAADWLAGDDQLRARLGDRGRRFVLARYHWPRIVERYVEFVRFEEAAAANALQPSHFAERPSALPV